MRNNVSLPPAPRLSRFTRQDAPSAGWAAKVMDVTSKGTERRYSRTSGWKAGVSWPVSGTRDSSRASVLGGGSTWRANSVSIPSWTGSEFPSTTWNTEARKRVFSSGASPRTRKLHTSKSPMSREVSSPGRVTTVERTPSSFFVAASPFSSWSPYCTSWKRRTSGSYSSRIRRAATPERVPL